MTTIDAFCLTYFGGKKVTHSVISPNEVQENSEQLTEQWQAHKERPGGPYWEVPGNSEVEVIYHIFQNTSVWNIIALGKRDGVDSLSVPQENRKSVKSWKAAKQDWNIILYIHTVF